MDAGKAYPSSAERRKHTLTAETVAHVECTLGTVMNVIALCADGIVGGVWLYLHRLVRACSCAKRALKP
jgi:hypothetical protein